MQLISADLTKEVLEIYNEKFQNDLYKITENNIKEVFKNLLLENQKENGLIFSNNVHSGEYYNFKIRIKKNRSLEEKLFRKNLIWNVTPKNEEDNPEDRKKRIEGFLLELDDLIGIKILTQVKRDSEKIYEILKKNIHTLKENKIVFKDFEKQPKPMKNGMEIFNIKGVYDDTYKFELQIKSQIESAWADMDHEMFYKDYDITPVRKSVQNTMNKVGKLLHEVDGLLFSIRNSKSEFQEDEQKMILLKKMNDEYQHFIQSHFKVEFSFDFSKHVNFYNFIATKFKINSQSIDGTKLIEPTLLKINEYEITKNYHCNHRKSYDTLINEIIYLAFNNLQNENQISDLNLKEFIDCYIEYLVTEFVTNYDFKRDMEIIISEILINCKNIDIYLNHSTYIKINEYFSAVYEAMLNKGFDIESEDIREIARILTLNYSLSIFEDELKLEDRHLELIDSKFNGTKTLEEIFNECKTEIAEKDDEIENELNKIHKKVENQLQEWMERDFI